jgi:hypothetical protein
MPSRLISLAAVIAIMFAADAQARRRAVSPGPPPSSGCTVTGLPNFFLSKDRGATFSRNRDPLQRRGNWGIAVLADDPQTLVTVAGLQVLDSLDGGCTWNERYTINETVKHSITVLGATGGRAFIWSEEFAFRYDRGEVIQLTLPEPPNGLGVDPGNRDHVRMVGIASGKAWESLDGGGTWKAAGASAGGTVNSAAFDPGDVNHIIAAIQSQGLRVSRDGGRSWNALATTTRTVCRTAFVPGMPNVVWMTLTTQGNQPAVYRSTNGGQRFDAVGPITGIENNVCLPLAVNPHNPDVAMIVYGTVRTYDAVTKSVTTSSCCGGWIERIAFSPDDPERLYVYASGQ